jgi:hypothetical protein
MKLKEVPTVLGIRDFDIPTEEADVLITAVFHSKVTACTPDHRPLTSVVETLYIQTEQGLRLLWTAHKDKRYINRSFKFYR